MPLLFNPRLSSTPPAGKEPRTREIRNFHTVNAGLYRGAQPGISGVKKLASLGIKTIVDLLPVSHRDPDDEAAAKAAGMSYINVPLSNIRRPTIADVEKVLAILNDPARHPVFVHCRRGADRTGTIIAAYRITHDGWSADQAIREAKQLTMAKWQLWMRDFIRDYANRSRSQSSSANHKGTKDTKLGISSEQKDQNKK